MSIAPFRFRLFQAVHRRLLRAYPAAFRAQYGAEMEDTFLDCLRDAGRRGRWAELRFVGRAAAETLVSGWRERVERRSITTPVTRPLSRSSVFYWQDVKYAIRLLLKAPVFTLLTIGVLGAGLGLSIFTFSFVYTAILKPIPVDAGAEIVRVMAKTSRGVRPIDAADLAVARRGIRSAAQLGAYQQRSLIVGRDEGRRMIDAVATEWNMFDVVRTVPWRGRGLRLDDQIPGAEPVVVLSHWAWRVVFGGDSTVIGSVIPINEIATRVIGVMPNGFGFPVAAEAWVPIETPLLEMTVAGRELLDVYARLAPHASAADLESELDVRLAQARSSRPVDPTAPATRQTVTVESFPIAQIGDEAPLIVAIMNLLAGLILLLACVNVTNLLLARANERARETAVRLALGAPRIRIVVQSMWESIILCLLGGLLATGIATWSLDAINGWTHARLQGNLAFWWVWSADRTTLLAAGAFVTLAIVMLGGVVSARAARTRITAVLQDGAQGAGSRNEGRFARGLVVTQVATVSILMYFGAMSGLVAYRVMDVDLGYDTKRLAEMSVELPAERYPNLERRAAVSGRMLQALSQLPEVGALVLRSRLANIANDEGEFEIRGGESAPSAPRPRAYVQTVAGATAVVGAELRQGRGFDGRDDLSGPRTALVSETLAAAQWPGRAAVGQEVRLVGIGEKEEWRTVVGVVSDVPMGDPLSRNRSPVAIYVPLAQTGPALVSATFQLRAGLPAAQAAMQRAIAQIDPLIPPAGVMSFDELVEKTTMIAKGTTKLFGACFGFALVLAVSGIYGLMARSISRRVREIGIRRALGATDRGILRLLLGQGSRQLGIGVVIALPIMVLIGLGFTMVLPIDAFAAVGTAVGVTVAIGLLVLGATYLPSRGALAIEVRDGLK